LPNDPQEVFPVNGTSYAAAYVSGVAALVRSKFPELTAAQAVRRLTATAQGAAQSPSNLVGAGSADPVAALTWQVPLVAPETPQRKEISAPPAPAVADLTPRIIAFAGTGALVVVVLATAAIAHRRKETEE
jgi:membrane-anchored mycosin MYCP